MTTEQVIKVFEVFFSGIPMRTIFDNESIQIYYVQDHIKYVVRYTISIDHLEVHKYNLNDNFPWETIIEGSPKDILKLAKLLQ